LPSTVAAGPFDHFVLRDQQCLVFHVKFLPAAFGRVSAFDFFFYCLRPAVAVPERVAGEGQATGGIRDPD
jgi:hypothetical protein